MKLLVLFPKSFLKNTLYAKVDDADYDWLSKYNWSYGESCGNNYAYTYTNGKTIRLHSLIMGNPPSEDLTVDHKNDDSLDNQRINLRWATKSQQEFNKGKQGVKCSSKYKGVSWNKYARKWSAYILYNGKRQHLGYFKDEIIAAKVYNNAAKKYYGDSVRLNIIEKEEQNGN